MDIRVFKFISGTRVEGPGLRSCIQVQGCPIRCDGCALPQTWSTKGGVVRETGELTRKILSIPEVEGVTFLGGEPFARAAALAEIGQQLQSNNKTVVTFTGYRIEELRKTARNDYEQLLAVTDILIDGPFEKEHVEFRRPWVGSSNQRFHFLTDRYIKLKHQLEGIPNRIEVRVTRGGGVFINGLGPADDIKDLISEL